MSDHLDDEYEEAVFGFVNGKRLVVRSDDKEPPHFHFGNYRIKIESRIPKSAEELRSQMIGDFTECADLETELKLLLKLFEEKLTGFDLTIYDAIRLLWAIFHNPCKDDELTAN